MKISNKKIYSLNVYTNPVLCIISILVLNTDISMWVTIPIVTFFFINFIVMIILRHIISTKKTTDERNIASQIIAAIEANDYQYAYRKVNDFDKESRLGSAFSFYILGVLNERIKDSDAEMLVEMDYLKQ